MINNHALCRHKKHFFAGIGDTDEIDESIKPQQDVTLTITRRDGSTQKVQLLLRIDTPIEVDYYRHGGILPFVLRELIGK